MYRVHYDSDSKLLADLNNIYMTNFKGGWIIDEIVGKKRELFLVLNLPVPTCEQVNAPDSTPEEPDELCGFLETIPETLEPKITDL